MSLINQMLQELDARGAPAALGGVLQGQIRAVPQRRGIHPAWWLALALSAILFGGGVWVWLVRGAPEAPAVRGGATALPLKIEMDLSRLPTAPVEVMPAMPIEQISAPLQAAAAPAPAALSPAAAVVPANEKALPIVGTLSGERLAPPEVPAQPLAATASLKPLPAPAPAVSPPPEIVIAKQVRELTPQQHAENDYRKASNLIQQGRTTDAFAALEQALRLDARHAGARQTLVALLIESRRQEEALRILREGLQLDAGQTGLAMILARMQLERGELKPALSTLQRSLPHAAERADYQAFLAALLQRDGRHREAVEHYALALRKSPENGLWWMGQAISLQAESRIPEAIAAYNRAKAGNGMSAELRAFVDEKLNSL